MTDEVKVQVENFFGKYKVRHYKKGQLIILNGEDVKQIYYLVKGRVKQYDVSYRGDEIILNIFRPLAFFPMSIAINKTPNTYIYEAETDTEVHQAPAEDVVAFIKSNPEVMLDLLSRLYRGVDGLLARLAHSMASSAKGRLMHETLLECRRFGEQQKDGSWMITITETALGSRTGLSRETISREMHKLVNDKLVKVQSGRIVIFDIDNFEDKLGRVI